MSYLRFKGIDNIGDALLCEQLEANIVEYFKWGMLNIGGFQNVERSTSGCYGGDYSILRPVNSPNYDDGQVWEAIRQDWVWESGIDYGYQPIAISGVYVNNVFYSADTTGVYSHTVSYPLGQIIFDSPVAVTKRVQVEHSYRNYYINHSSVPWFKQLFFNSHRPDNAQFTSFASGVFQTLAENRIQMPAIIVEVVPERNMEGLQIGGGQIVGQDVMFHIFAESPGERNKALDIITYQKDATLSSFDKNAIIADDKFPLNYDGSLREDAITYPEMVKFPDMGGEYFWTKIFVKKAKTIPVVSEPPLYRGCVKATFEIDLYEL